VAILAGLGLVCCGCEQLQELTSGGGDGASVAADGEAPQEVVARIADKVEAVTGQAPEIAIQRHSGDDGKTVVVTVTLASKPADPLELKVKAMSWVRHEFPRASGVRVKIEW